MDERRPLFDPGRVTATPAAIELLRKVNVDPVTLIDRHVSDDFGEVGKVSADSLHGDPADGHSDGLALNTLAVLGGGDRILSIYALSTGQKVWVETAADHSYTTIYLLEEY